MYNIRGLTMAKATSEEWVKKAMSVHGTRYLYTNTCYVDYRERIIVTCRVHGDFIQIPGSHIAGKGCYRCGNVKKSRSLKRLKGMTRREWILKASENNAGRYNYDLVKYVDTRTPVEIQCLTHGSFWTNPRQHLLGHGCKKCADEGNKGLYSDSYFLKFPERKDDFGILYFLKFTNRCTFEIFYKVGITSCNVIDRMYSNTKTHNIEILVEVSTTIYNAYTKEQYILETFSEFRYRPIVAIRGGNTECLSINIANEIKEI